MITNILTPLIITTLLEVLRDPSDDYSATLTASAGRMLFAFYPDLDNIGSSANPGIDRNGICGAVGHTGPTFHAGVEINEMSLLVLQFKN